MFKNLKGFRDFYPEEFAKLNHLFRVFRQVARNYGFQEYNVPILEPLDLYVEKSGEEIVDQLFAFEDKGKRQVALRPEITPSLARLIGAKANSLKLPVKWFNIGECFRYERQQKGRTRSFYQFNADIFGESGCYADAELLNLLIDILRGLGLGSNDFKVRFSDRELWVAYLGGKGLSETDIYKVLAVVDKSERESKEWAINSIESFLTGQGASLCEEIDELKSISDLGELEAFFKSKGDVSETLKNRLEDWKTLLGCLKASGTIDFIKIDLGIVRGLAYYTGFVYEAFETTGKNRALAGGGRYNNLVPKLSNVKEMPAAGFAIGDVTLQDCLSERGLLTNYIFKSDFYVVIGGPEERLVAQADISMLRQLGFSVEYAFKESAFGKQLKEASRCGARFALVYGSEELKQKTVKIRDMSSRKELDVQRNNLMSTIRELTETGII